MSLPAPEAGLVIRYSYLWLREHQEGREEGVKDRPCAIILATQAADGGTRARVVPVTHSPPASAAEAIELPASVKRLLGLDDARSWVVLSESNLFTWPGPDLRRVGDDAGASVAYGFLPPGFFRALQTRFLQLASAAPSGTVARTE